MGNSRRLKIKKYSIFSVIVVLLITAAIFKGCSIMEEKNLKTVTGLGTANAGSQQLDSETINQPAQQQPVEQESPESSAGNDDSSSVPPLDGTDQNVSTEKVMAENVDSILVLVNKHRNLPSDYEPDDLVVPDVTFAFQGDSPRRYMRMEAAKALEELFAKAEADNISIAATSGYRPYDMQKSIFERNARQYGEKVANMTSAYPGQSEHQTGLAMDITSKSVGFTLVDTFGDTAEGKWLKENAADFGFIIRYQKGMESITGYSYEPWHIRYVGREAAREITERNITLEEYLGFKSV